MQVFKLQHQRKCQPRPFGRIQLATRDAQASPSHVSASTSPCRINGQQLERRQDQADVQLHVSLAQRVCGGTTHFRRQRPESDIPSIVGSRQILPQTRGRRAKRAHGAGFGPAQEGGDYVSPRRVPKWTFQLMSDGPVDGHQGQNKLRSRARPSSDIGFSSPSQ